MKRLRDFFGGGDSRARSAAPQDAAEPPEDEAARERHLQREFYRGLSEVARHELQFQDYAPEAPSQFKRSGRWVVADEVEARDASGTVIYLERETPLDYVATEGDPEPGLTFRFQMATGEQVAIAGDPGEEWPASIVRESELRTSGDS